MRVIKTELITETISRLCREANNRLPDADVQAIKEIGKTEDSPVGRSIFTVMLENLDCARQSGLPICQDTGMAVVFADIGQEIKLEGALLSDAVDDGVRRGYREGYLRCSVVRDPFNRVNTGDNTPAVLHTRIVPGDKITLTVAPKGFGSENMSAVRMLNPSAKAEEVINFVRDTVAKAGSNPCPPVVVGVGIGGTFEGCAMMAKRALLRGLTEKNKDPFYRDLEEHILNEINGLGIGPQGLGGRVTALAVSILSGPTHIAGLPVAVNMGCHVNRHASAVL